MTSELQPLADAHMRCISSGFNKGMKVFVDIALKGKSHGVT